MNGRTGSEVAHSIEAKAADWLTLGESRPLTPKEQADFDHWLAADSRHEAAVAELRSAWAALDSLSAYPRPADRSDDPDFFARPKPFRRRIVRSALLVATAAVVLFASNLWRRLPAPFPAPSGAPMVSRFLHLPDGSEVELKSDSLVVQAFTASERRLRLVRGEAQFTVAKNPNRPFVVEVNGVAVRALGTAFNIKLDSGAVEVLVTEGKVAVSAPASAVPAAGLTPPRVVTFLTERQRAVMDTVQTADPIQPQVETLPSNEIDRLLAWQTSRLVFNATPLSEAVERFNRHLAGQPGGPRLIVDDPQVGATRISGRLRPDNVESFVELLASSFGVAAERRPNGDIILRRGP